MEKNKILELGEKVARLLVENRVPYHDVDRIFREATFHLTVAAAEAPINPQEDYAQS